MQSASHHRHRICTITTKTEKALKKQSLADCASTTLLEPFHCTTSPHPRSTGPKTHLHLARAIIPPSAPLIRSMTQTHKNPSRAPRGLDDPANETRVFFPRGRACARPRRSCDDHRSECAVPQARGLQLRLRRGILCFCRHVWTEVSLSLSFPQWSLDFPAGFWLFTTRFTILLAAGRPCE